MEPEPYTSHFSPLLSPSFDLLLLFSAYVQLCCNLTSLCFVKGYKQSAGHEAASKRTGRREAKKEQSD